MEITYNSHMVLTNEQYFQMITVSISVTSNENNSSSASK